MVAKESTDKTTLRNEIFQTSNDAYDRIPALRSSHLKAFIKSPRHYIYEVRERGDIGDKANLLLGLYVHALILQPETVAEEFTFTKVRSRNALEYKDAYANLKRSGSSKRLLLASEKETGEAIAEAVLADPHVRELVARAYPEITATAHISDVWCKCRMDGYIPDSGIIFDIKTTSEPIVWFGSVIRRFGYDTSAAYYIDVVNEASFGEGSDDATRPPVPVSRFVFIVVESKPPYSVRLLELSPEFIRDGRERYLSVLPAYKECLRTDIWPGYDNSKIEIISPEGFRKSADTDTEVYLESEESWRANQG